MKVKSSPFSASSRIMKVNLSELFVSFELFDSSEHFVYAELFVSYEDTS